MPNPNFAKSKKLSDVVSELITEMDHRVGQVIDAVKEAGIEDNTIFILSSDNATGGAIPQDGTSTNAPWRGDFFYTPFEGSMRVPAMIRWPGKVSAAVVTEQMLAAVDWLPTLAGMVGASNRVPKDRPIDGVDASAFMLGKSQTTGRDSYMFFGVDGELLSIKWKHFKTVLRYTVDSPAMQSDYFKPQLPMMYDLSKDRHEDVNLWYADLTNAWILAPVAKLVGAYEASVKKYPNIKVGEEFRGYKK
jgi:arylsulfatase